MEPTLVELLAHKRDGHAHREQDIARLVRALSDGSLADYQMSAWLMAVYLRGLSDDETAWLTQAMLRSGIEVDLSHVPGFKVDKHSTGGVGDKVSIALAPLVAAAGAPVPMVSGRGLGHTGGTLDKLEAIPGFSTQLSTADYARIVAEVGTCMIGQTADIAPADKRMYALRDVTATVECVPLIVASILSKKLAEGIDGLVLDVKVGRGAFMKTEVRARELADALVRVGTLGGKRVTAVLTRMDAPLGMTVGNANETREALELLHGRGPEDLKECTYVLASEMLRLAGLAETDQEAKGILDHVIASGAAVETMAKMVRAQGGDAAVVFNPALLVDAPVHIDVAATSSGYVTEIDALEVGLTAVAMGAGRTRADQPVDPLVGIDVLKKPGHEVREGECVARIHVRSGTDASAFAQRISRAYKVGDHAPSQMPLVLDILRSAPKL